MSAAGVEPWLREVLRCPACLGELADSPAPEGADAGLTCTADGCGLAYRVVEGIPVLLVDEAVRPDGTPATAADAKR